MNRLEMLFYAGSSNNEIFSYDGFDTIIDWVNVLQILVIE